MEHLGAPGAADQLSANHASSFLAASRVVDEASRRTLHAQSTVYQGHIWNVVSDTFSLTPDSAPLTRDYIDHPGAVAVVVLNEHHQVLLLRQYRHPVHMNLWEIPAGLLDVEGEDFVVGAARELAEEADLAAAQWHVLTDFFNSPGSSSEAIRIYLARGITEIAEDLRHVRTDEEAEIEFVWVDLEEAAAKVLAGNLHNPSAVVGILATAQAARTGFTSLRPGDAPWPEHPSQRHT